jgi:tetratricopeptide (TPR) repeat protein
MIDQPARPPSRGYIPPPRLAEVGIAPDLSAYLRVLVVLASPVISDNPTLDLRAEWRTISAAIGRQAAPVACYRLAPPTWGALQQALARPGAWPVVHISAHGTKGGLYLEDELGRERFVSAQHLARAFIGSEVRLVILNACSSHNPAAALVAAGVPAAVATTGSIYDDDARLLAERLYAGLSGGRPIADSLDLARRALGDDALLVLEVQAGGGEAVLCPEPQPGLGPIVYDGLPPRSAALPSQFGFLGRGRELVNVAGRLSDSRIRAVCITGLGGVGKTTLTAEVAHRQAWRFPDGIVWLSAQNLPGLGLADLLRELELVLGSLDIKDKEPDDQQHAAMAALRRSACLVVLDSLEQVKDAAAHRALLGFLRGLEPWGRSKAILVSRLATPEVDALEGSFRLPLRGMAEGAALRKLAAEARRVGMAELSSVAERERRTWVRAVDRNPKMIEWLAGLRDIARIRHTMGTLPPDYQTRVTALLDSSLATLTPAGRALLLRLRLFAGPADYAAVQAMCADDLEAGVALDELRAASLVQQDRGRYNLHQLVEDHVRASEAWKAADTAPWWERLAGHYLDVARRQRPRLSGPDYVDALDVLDAAYPNIRAAWKEAVTSDHWQRMRDFASALHDYFERRGLWADWIAWTQAGLDACERAGDAISCAGMQNNLGEAYRQLPTGDRAGNLGKAIECYGEALRVYTPEAAPLDYATTQNNLGNAYRELPTGDRAENLQKAVACYGEALCFWTPEATPFDYARTQNNLGLAYANLPTGDRAENLQQAVACYGEALRFWTPEAAPLYYARTQNNLGNAYADLPMGDRAENLQQAIEYYGEALRFRTPETAPLGYAMTQNNLGNAYADLPTGDRAENLQQAIECYGEALRFWTPEAAPLYYATTQNNLGTAYADLPTRDRAENLQKAIEYYGEALRFWTPEAAPFDYARTQNNLGEAYADLPTGDRAENVQQAVECYGEALRFLTPEAAPLDYAMTQNNLGAAYADLPTGDRAENLGKAIECYGEALRFWTPGAAPLDYATTQNNLGEAYRRLPMGDRAENLQKAIACYREALAIEYLPPWERERYERNLSHALGELEAE